MPDPYALTEQVAIVTGAARGIGKAIVETLLEADARHVVAVDILDEEIERLAAGQDRVTAAHLDVTDEVGWAELLSTTVEAEGGVDILVNNAGMLLIGLLEDTKPDAFRRLLDVNVVGPFLGIRAAAPYMTKAGSGAIVNISSVSGVAPNNSVGAYGASKFAVRGLTRTAAMELGPRGVRVNSVHPGGVDTPMTNPFNLPREEIDVRYHAFVPMQRACRPHEVARGVLYLASEAASFCNGTELVIDGGMIAGQFLAGMPGELVAPDRSG